MGKLDDEVQRETWIFLSETNLQRHFVNSIQYNISIVLQALEDYGYWLYCIVLVTQVNLSR